MRKKVIFMKDKIKKLYRSKKEKVILGVCGGLGRYFNIDPLLVRIIFIIFTLVKGIGVLVYFISAIIIPLEPKEEAKKYSQNREEKAQSLVDELVKKT